MSCITKVVDRYRINIRHTVLFCVSYSVTSCSEYIDIRLHNLTHNSFLELYIDGYDLKLGYTAFQWWPHCTLLILVSYSMLVKF